MKEELNIALKELSTELEGKANAAIEAQLDKVKEMLGDYVGAEEVKTLKDSLQEMQDANKELQKHLDDLSIKMKNSAAAAEDAFLTPYGKYEKAMQDDLAEKFENIKQTRKGNATRVEIKATMTLGANLTGGAVNTYKPDAVELPGNKVNVTDLIPTVSSATGQYVFYREGAVTNAPTSVAEGAAKTEMEFDFVEVALTAQYLSGYIRISKVMLQDLPFLGSFLPRALRREYFRAENASFYTTISTGATASTNNSGGVTGIIEDMGVLEAADYEVTGIVLNPADWAALAAAAIPGNTQSAIVEYMNGRMTIAGCPVFKAPWVTAGTYLMGDWFWAKKIAVDGLAVEFFEQDANNVTTNLITVRVEQRVVCALERPAAFINGTIAAT